MVVEIDKRTDVSVEEFKKLWSFVDTHNERTVVVDGIPYPPGSIRLSGISGTVEKEFLTAEIIPGSMFMEVGGHTWQRYQMADWPFEIRRKLTPSPTS